MEDLILQFLGKGGIITIAAFLINTIDKRFTKTGLFEDLGNMAKKVGAGAGKAVSGFIPFSKVEPELEEVVEKFQGVFNVLVDSFQRNLEGGDDSDKKEG